MIKAIFWDNDGVLVQTEHLYFKANREILENVGITLTKEMFIEISLKQGKSVLQLAREKGFCENEIEDLRKKRNSLYCELLSQSNFVNENVECVLSKLHNNYIMGVVTSSKKEHFDIIHKSSGLLKYFNFVITREDYQRAKPNPEPYLIAIQKSGCDKKECLAIEDSTRGLISAKMAGIKCYIVPNELTKGSDFSLADKVLNNLTEILVEL